MEISEKKVKEKLAIADIGENIGFELGSTFVKEFYDKYPEMPMHYTIGKNAINKILSQPNCEGLIISQAIDEFGRLTMVFAGVNNSGTPITVYPVKLASGEIVMQEGDIFDRILPPRDEPGSDPKPPHNPWAWLF